MLGEAPAKGSVYFLKHIYPTPLFYFDKFLGTVMNKPKPGGNNLKKFYEDVVKFIKNGEFVFDMSDQMTVKNFSKKCGLKFSKIANCVLNTQENFPDSNRKFIDGTKWLGKVVDYKPIAGKEELWNMKGEWVYVIVYDGRIVKLGMTSDGLSGRFGSYNCGTKKAMSKGSCSTTNFVLTECNYLALDMDCEVEIYGYQIGEVYAKTEKVGGKVLEARAQVAPAYESRLMELYTEFTGSIPPLCGQKGMN
jgi:hypothetical protein